MLTAFCEGWQTFPTCSYPNSQYAQPSLGFDLDVAVLEQVFGTQRVVVERALSRRRLSDLLSTQRFDIVHLVAGVDPGTGESQCGTAENGGGGRTASWHF